MLLLQPGDPNHELSLDDRFRFAMIDAQIALGEQDITRILNQSIAFGKMIAAGSERNMKYLLRTNAYTVELSLVTPPRFVERTLAKNPSALQFAFTDDYWSSLSACAERIGYARVPDFVQDAIELYCQAADAYARKGTLEMIMPDCRVATIPLDVALRN